MWMSSLLLLLWWEGKEAEQLRMMLAHKEEELGRIRREKEEREEEIDSLRSVLEEARVFGTRNNSEDRSDSVEEAAVVGPDFVTDVRARVQMLYNTSLGIDEELTKL